MMKAWLNRDWNSLILPKYSHNQNVFLQRSQM
uniref:Uncharacterized protein n=1 Tax=Anguilla anguilla TaxID=7936 RepID=A0A0E9V5J2_ANGAN